MLLICAISNFKGIIMGNSIISRMSMLLLKGLEKLGVIDFCLFLGVLGILIEIWIFWGNSMVVILLLVYILVMLLISLLNKRTFFQFWINISVIIEKVLWLWESVGWIMIDFTFPIKILSWRFFRCTSIWLRSTNYPYICIVEIALRILLGFWVKIEKNSTLGSFIRLLGTKKSCNSTWIWICLLG